MCNCPNSSWVQNANTFLNRNRNNHDGKWYTVAYLLQNDHCGIDNRTSIDEILAYLQANGINLSREQFQQTVLGELKRKGIVATLVYPGSAGGVFIPCNEDEVKTAAEQILNRVCSEIENIEGVAQSTSFGNLFSLLRRIVSCIKGQL